MTTVPCLRPPTVLTHHIHAIQYPAAYWSIRNHGSFIYLKKKCHHSFTEPQTRLLYLSPSSYNLHLTLNQKRNWAKSQGEEEKPSHSAVHMKLQTELSEVESRAVRYSQKKVTKLLLFWIIKWLFTQNRKWNHNLFTVEWYMLLRNRFTEILQVFDASKMIHCNFIVQFLYNYMV